MLIALNKPYGVLCQFSGDGSRPTLAGYVRETDVYPAGRLDHDSEGLLLLTDDGRLAHRLTDPRHKQPKTYLVQVDGAVTDEAIAALRSGVTLNDGPTLPAGAEHAAEPGWLWPRDQLAHDHLARGAQPPGPAHDRGRRFSHLAADPRAHRRIRAGRPCSRRNTPAPVGWASAHRL